MKILSRGTCLALALALLIVGFASPLPASGAGSASLRIPGAGFRPSSNTAGFEYYYRSSMYATSSPGVWWTAPVHLPQGAMITNVRMYYYDSNATYDCNGQFMVCDFATEGGFHSPYWSSSGSAGFGYADSAAINHTVDNTQYGYLLLWRPNAADSSIRLEGFQIFYTPPPGRAAVIPLY